MKKTISLITALVVIFVSAACGRSEDQKPEEVQGQESDNAGEDKEVGRFDFEKKKVMLNSGYEMPILGLGTYSLDHDTCVNSVKTLLQNGGRLIDTAYMYGNEESGR